MSNMNDLAFWTVLFVPALMVIFANSFGAYLKANVDAWAKQTGHDQHLLGFMKLLSRALGWLASPQFLQIVVTATIVATIIVLIFYTMLRMGALQLD